MKYLNILSYSLNFIFIIAFFFKSAINDILKERYKEWRELRRDKINKLKILRTNVEKLKPLSLIMMLDIRDIELNKNAPDFNELLVRVRRNRKDWGDIYNSILTDKADYPTEIVELIEIFFENIQNNNGSMLSKIPTNDEMQSMHNELEIILNNLIASIDVKINSK